MLGVSNSGLGIRLGVPVDYVSAKLVPEVVSQVCLWVLCFCCF